MKCLVTARKLQTACNQFGARLLLNTRQWYSKDQNRAVTAYIIVQSKYDEGKKRDVNIELFSTYSQLQLVLFLRDYWYTLNGWEVPKNNTVWEEIKNAEKETSNISVSA